MAPEDAQRLFTAQLARAGFDLAALQPADGIAAMLTFYREERADGCPLEEDGDMLLYQWGCNDWGAGETFDINITRQFIRPDGDDVDILQLALTCHFAPTPERRELGWSNAWCDRPAAVTAFDAGIRQDAAYRMHSKLTPEKVTLTQFIAG